MPSFNCFKNFITNCLNFNTILSANYSDVISRIEEIAHLGFCYLVNNTLRLFNQRRIRNLRNGPSSLLKFIFSPLNVTYECEFVSLPVSNFSQLFKGTHSTKSPLTTLMSNALFTPPDETKMSSFVASGGVNWIGDSR